MNELENSRSYLATLKEKGGWPALLDEINFTGAKTLPQDYHRPEYVQSLRPEEEAFLTIDEMGSVEVRNYETLTIKRCFSIGDYVGIFIEKCCIYVLKYSIPSKDPFEKSGRLHLSVYSGEGDLMERYNSDLLDNITRFTAIECMVVDREELLLSKIVYFKSDYVSFHFKIEKESQKIIHKCEWDHLQLLGKPNEIYFFRNHKELVKFDDKNGFLHVHTFDDKDIRFNDKKDAGLYFRRIDGNKRAFWYYDTVLQTIHYINEELQWMLDERYDLNGYNSSYSTQSTEKSNHSRFIYDNEILNVYHISDSSMIVRSAIDDQLCWVRNEHILDLSQPLKSKDDYTLFFDNHQILLFSSNCVEKLEISENSFDKPVYLLIPSKKKNHDIYSKLIAISSEYIIRSPEHNKTDYTFIAIRDSGCSFSIDDNFVNLQAIFENGDVLFSNDHVIKEDRRNESLLKWNQNKENTEACELKFIGEEFSEDSLFLIERKCINPNDSNLLIWCVTQNIILWDTESKVWRQIISLSDRNVEIDNTFAHIKDYNDRYILFQSWRSSGHLSFKLYKIQDDAFFKFDIKYGVIESLIIAYNGICLCSDGVVAFVSILDNTIKVIDMESGTSRQIPFDEIDMTDHAIIIELRYYAKTNILQVYDYETISFYSLYDLDLVAKLRVFSDDTFIFTSYKDTRYFYSQNPDDTLRVINQLYKNEVLKDEELESYISEFNSWDHFNKLLFQGEEIPDLEVKGLSEREPPKPLPE